MRILLLGTSVLVLAARSYALSYSVTDLGTLGGSQSPAKDVNNSGQVTGFSLLAGNTELHAYLYDAAHGMVDISTPNAGIGYKINDSGQVLGSLGSGSRLFFYSGGIAHDIGTLGGSWAYSGGLNNAGTITGWSARSNGTWGPFIYSNGVMTDLGPVLGDAYKPSAINDAEQIVGDYNLPATYHAFLFDGNNTIDLGTLGGARSDAMDINDLGEIVGWADTETGEIHAFKDSNGTMTDLGVIGGGSGDSYAFGINAGGEIVGQSNGKAFLYDGTAMIDLNEVIDNALGYRLDSASSINDYGQIVGSMVVGSEVHGFLLTPIPEPTAPTLYGIGLAVGLQRQRKSSRSRQRRE